MTNEKMNCPDCPRRVLELGQGDAAWLRDTLLTAAGQSSLEETEHSSYGVRHRLDVQVERRGEALW